MKKVFIGIVAAVFCVALTAPAFAEVKVEGSIQSDFYYFSMSKERVISGAGGAAGGNTSTGLAKNATTNQDDWSTTRINMPQPSNRLTVRYTGEDKVVNGYMQLRAGGVRANAAQASFGNAGVNSESAFSWEYAWIDWHINPSLYFRFGRQDQVFANAYAPGQVLGWNDQHIIGLGFGNITAQSRDAIRAFIKFNNNVRMEIEILDPNNESLVSGANNGELVIPAQAGTNAANAREGSTMPRFDISLPMQFGNFKLEPGFTWLEQKWDQVFPGSDDSYTVWGLTLGGSAAFGPFSIMGEFTYGNNLGPNGSHWGTVHGQAVVYNPTGTNANVRAIEDGETIAWFLQLQFDFGPAAVQGIIGMNSGSNDGSPAVRDAAEWDITQWMYGINVPIKVTKTFTITPSLFYYDFDSSSTVGSVSNTFDVDRGSEWVFGATFNLAF